MHLFAAGHSIIAAINCATEYLLRSHLKTSAINCFFFLILFPIYCCVYTKTTANDTQQIRFFPLLKVKVLQSNHHVEEATWESETMRERYL